MNCRRALQTDYEEICRWWKAHGWSCVPIELLPSGWVVEKDGKMLCAGFLYIASNAPVGYLEYIVSNPDNGLKENYKAIDYLMDEIVKFAKYSLVKAMFARVHQRGLEKLYNKHGFKSGDVVKDMIWL